MRRRPQEIPLWAPALMRSWSAALTAGFTDRPGGPGLPMPGAVDGAKGATWDQPVRGERWNAAGKAILAG